MLLQVLSVLLLISSLFILQYKSDDELIGKTMYAKYSIKFQDTKCVNFDNSSIKLDCNFKRINGGKTIAVFNLEFSRTMKNLTSLLIGYAKNDSANVYNIQVFKFDILICAALKTNAFGYGRFVNGVAGNLTQCPIAPGYYYITSYDANGPYFEVTPEGDYKFEYTFMEDNVVQAMINVYAKIKKIHEF